MAKRNMLILFIGVLCTTSCGQDSDQGRIAEELPVIFWVDGLPGGGTQEFRGEKYFGLEIYDEEGVVDRVEGGMGGEFENTAFGFRLDLSKDASSNLTFDEEFIVNGTSHKPIQINYTQNGGSIIFTSSSGSLTITQADANVVKGVFNLVLTAEDQSSSLTVTGRFAAPEGMRRSCYKLGIDCNSVSCGYDENGEPAISWIADPNAKACSGSN